MSARPGFSAEWLRLREPADALARSTELAAEVAVALAADVAARPAGGSGVVVHDLGCGTGSMRRWLAPRLPGPQHWVLHDRDPALLALAVRGIEGVEARLGDVGTLTSQQLAGAGLVTTSALLDLLTREELGRLAAACTGAGCPALFTLSVAGRVELRPEDPLDGEIAAAFNRHQRRVVAGRRLLGPDAVAAAVDAFAQHGAQVRVRPSPWRLGPEETSLIDWWLQGWVSAAAEQQPDLPVSGYLGRRSTDAAAGRLRVVVHHEDLLALPPGASFGR